MSKYILLQDPWHEYALQFALHIHQKHGYRTIGFYSNRADFVRNKLARDVLCSDWLESMYEVAPGQLSKFASHIGQRYDFAAVIPVNEPAVAAAATLAEKLGLSWSQPETVRRFRNKFLLKAFVREQDPTLRINATHQAGDAADIERLRNTAEFSRFVLKPIDGYGNRSIGMFDQHSAIADIEHYLHSAQGAVLMEEYIDGAEYFINGQTDALGAVTVLAVFAYQRVAANGRTNIDYATRRVASSEPIFKELSAYSERVVRATGLRRSPFHLELKVDARGPCLIEVAARLPGLRNAFLTTDLHGPGFDWFDIAAHYYLVDDSYGPLPVDWPAYDAGAVRYVHGIAHRSERIHRLCGLDRVEALPAFHDWVKRPGHGEMVQPTRDCLSMPWSVIIKTVNEVQAEVSESRIRDLIGWNDSLSSSRRLISSGLIFAQRVTTALNARLRSRLLPLQNKVMVLSKLKTNDAQTASSPHWSNRLFNSLMRHYELARFGKHDLPFPPQVPTQHAAVARAAVDWAEQFLAKPHADLGRKGPICPFVKHTVDIGKYFVSVRPEIDGNNLYTLRRIVLQEAAALLRHSPNVGSKGAFSSLVMVFPNIADAQLSILDSIHSELKTALMERDLMFSPFHKHSTKPSVSNPEFKVFRAPFPALVVRHLDVRDIAFLNANRKAFLHFHSRYAAQFAQGKVSDEFGYVRMFNEACARFGMTPAME
jgi:hypothetical protein